MAEPQQSFVDIKNQFPIFNGALKGWAYLDSAATSQKPASVIESITNFYREENANIHRGLYELSSNATSQYESIRKKVADFIGAGAKNEIAFTKGTTESINIVANSFSEIIGEGDNIVISTMEHHANLIPWQQVCRKRKASLQVIQVDENGDLILDDLPKMLNSKTKLVAITHISNTLGTINQVEEIIIDAHKKNIPVLIDGAQSVGHYPIDVTKMDVDFLVFSGHKMFGPMGIGILYAKEKYHQLMRSLNFGGGAIKNVSLAETEFLNFPYSVEAGTPHVAGVIGLGAAIDFINQLDLNESFDYTYALAAKFKEAVKSLGFVRLVGAPKHYGSIVSFMVDDIHAHDVASYLGEHQIAIRAGHHCTQPLHDRLGIPATVRASFSIYNAMVDVDKILEALVGLKKFWS